VVIGVAVTAVMPLLAVLATGRTLLSRDTARLYDPIRALVVEALRSGKLPLWNPHEALGQPVLGQLIHGVLHPVSLALAALAPRSGAEGMLVAYIGVAAAGCALLVRTLGGSASAAVAAGLVYAWSGYVLGMSSNLVFLAAGATAPWTLAGLRVSAGGGGRTLALGALGVAALHLAGDPQWVVAAVLIGALLAFDAQRWTGLARAAAAVALGTGLAAIQLVPAWFAFAEMGRAGGLSAVDRVQWALSPWRIIELALPGLFGAPGEDAGIFLWLGGPNRDWVAMPFVPSVAVGATTLVLAFAGAAANRTGRALAGAAGVLLWLALGTRGGAEQLLHSVPVWGSFRYAEKLVGPLTLSLAVLAALGLDTVRQGALQGRWKWVAATGGAALAGALALSSGGLDGAAPGLPAWPLLAARLGRGLAHAGTGLVALGLVLGAARSAGWRRWGAATIAAIAGAGALAAAPLALDLAPAGIIDAGWLERLENGDGPVRIATPGETYPYFFVQRSLEPSNGRLGALARHGVPSFTTAIRVDNVGSYTGLSQRRWVAFDEMCASDAVLAWRAWRRLGLTHVIQKRPASAEEADLAALALTDARVVEVNRDWFLAAWAVPHRPWAFFARSVRLAEGADEARATLQNVLASGSEDVVLEAPGAPPLGSGRVLAVARGTDEVGIEAETPQSGLLVMADAFAPGWTATVDGQSVPIWPADAMVRAVPIPAGRHRVVLRYACPGLAGGVIVSTLTLAMMALLIAWRRDRARALSRRRVPSSPESPTPEP
jgi:hypothetical protein